MAGLNLLENKQYLEARNSFTEAIKIQPQNAHLYEARATANEKINLKESLLDANMVIQLTPTSARVRF